MDSPHVPIGDRVPLPHGHGSVITPKQPRGGILTLLIPKGFCETLYSESFEVSFSKWGQRFLGAGLRLGFYIEAAVLELQTLVVWLAIAVYVHQHLDLPFLALLSIVEWCVAQGVLEADHGRDGIQDLVYIGLEPDRVGPAARTFGEG